MSKLDGLPEELKKQLEDALAEREPEIPRAVPAVTPQVPKAPKHPLGGGIVSAAPKRSIQMDAEDRLRIENIALKEALLKARIDAAKSEIVRARDELRRSVVNKYGVANTESFSIDQESNSINIQSK